MKKMLTLLILAFSCIGLYAQDFIYLNQESEFTKDKDNASQLAVITKDKDSDYYLVDFFSKDSTLIRSSQYKQFGKTPDKQILHGKTTYKFAHSNQDSLVCYYRDNFRVGAATYYYPNGEKHIDCSYKDGLLNGLLSQYYPNGSIKRKDIYEKGTAKASTFYPEEGEVSSNNPFYVAPTPSDTDMLSIIQELVHKIQLSAMGKICEHKMYLEVTFDPQGKFEKAQIIQSDDPKSIKLFTKAAYKTFQDKTFTPAMMDNQSVQGSIILPISYGRRTTRITVQK